MTRLHHPALLVVVVWVILVAACGGPTTGPSTPTDTRITVATSTESISLDPAVDGTIRTQRVLENVFDTLYVANEKGELKPSLALSAKNVDPTTWDVQLRQGIKFHSGEDLTAESVVFTYTRIKDPALKSPMAVNVNFIKSVTATDTYTVRFATTEPYAPFLARLTQVYIVPKKTLTDMTDGKFGKAPVGTGPFKFGEWVKDDHLDLEANLDYWGGAPKVRALRFRPIPEAATRVAALLNGEVDLAEGVLPTQTNDVEARSNLRVARVHTILTSQVLINTAKKPLDNVKVRQALNQAVDVDTIIKTVKNGAAYRSANAVAPFVYGYSADLKPYTYNVDRAKALLSEAGYPNGLDIELIGRSGDKEVMEAIGAQLGKAGVRAKLVPMESGEWLKHYFDKTFELSFFTLTGFVDADYTLFLMFHSKGRGFYTGKPELDAAIEQSRKELDATKRLKMLQDLMVKVSDEAPWVFMYDEQGVYGINKRIGNWEPRPDAGLLFKTATAK